MRQCRSMFLPECSYGSVLLIHKGSYINLKIPAKRLLAKWGSGPPRLLNGHHSGSGLKSVVH